MFNYLLDPLGFSHSPRRQRDAHATPAFPIAVVTALSLVTSFDRAIAACDPASTANVVATCTGVTVNQGNGPPGTSAAVAGYGSGAETNATVTVVSGASVTGDNLGV